VSGDQPDLLTLLPSVEHGVWRICTHGEPDLVAVFGSEYILTSHPLTVDGDQLRAQLKRVYDWGRVNLVRLDGSTFLDTA
jgi:hypothetical protein